MSQNSEILRFLTAGNAITAEGAIMKFNCFRLAARVEELRGQGHKIITTMVKYRGKRFAWYSLA